MNYFTLLIAIGLILVALYFSSEQSMSFFSGPSSRRSSKNKNKTDNDDIDILAIEIKNEGQSENTAEVIPGGVSIDKGEETNGEIQAPGGVYDYPMEDEMNYPSGVLPNRVGTFHPTNYYNRFVCQGCDTCGPTKDSVSTDDSGRNYPELIDRIRASRTNEYPFYDLN